MPRRLADNICATEKEFISMVDPVAKKNQHSYVIFSDSILKLSRIVQFRRSTIVGANTYCQESILTMFSLRFSGCIGSWIWQLKFGNLCLKKMKVSQSRCRWSRHHKKCQPFGLQLSGLLGQIFDVVFRKWKSEVYRYSFQRLCIYLKRNLPLFYYDVIRLQIVE